ncbi:hypothetical protein [Lignipirellula cremea]|uniref:hypothetical protein n=1 Tax=Lignipirellula cremea TaxID=2528010 RepID=UPI0011A673A3|nr:hypothetical protein [Lignipirellula cremea]
MSGSKFLQYLQYFHAAYLSRPKADRVLYRAIRQMQPRSLLEIGLVSAERSVRLLRFAARYTQAELRFTGIDQFEQRGAGQPALTLKKTHQLLKQTGAKVQLAPGDPFMALARYANVLKGIDLVIVSAHQDQESLARSWFYLPRMLHERSRIFIEKPEDGATQYVETDLTAIRKQIDAGSTRRRAA